MLKPWLESKIRHSWLDPRKFNSVEEFKYAYDAAWGFAQAAEEILAYVEQVQMDSEQLTKKEKGEIESVLRKAIS